MINSAPVCWSDLSWFLLDLAPNGSHALSCRPFMVLTEEVLKLGMTKMGKENKFQERGLLVCHVPSEALLG